MLTLYILFNVRLPTLQCELQDGGDFIMMVIITFAGVNPEPGTVSSLQWMPSIFFCFPPRGPLMFKIG